MKHALDPWITQFHLGPPFRVRTGPGHNLERPAGNIQVTPHPSRGAKDGPGLSQKRGRGSSALGDQHSDIVLLFVRAKAAHSVHE